MLYVYAIDTNMAFTKKVYKFKFKSIEYKYIPNHKSGKQDDLFVISKEEEEKNYRQVTELFSSFSLPFSLGGDGVFIVEPRGILHNHTVLDKYTPSSAASRSLRADIVCDDFVPVCPIIDENENKIARLYRIAKSSNDSYFKTLFLWHCLCVQNKSDDNETVCFINNNINDIHEQISNELNEIINNPYFNKDSQKLDKKNLGEYIKNGFIHCISHIERKETSHEKSFTLDSINELRHVNNISKILDALVTLKMEKMGMRDRQDDTNYFSYII